MGVHAQVAGIGPTRSLVPRSYNNRSVVERFFIRIKHWRAIASRYDKHATVYRGGIIILAAIVDWLKHLRDTA